MKAVTALLLATLTLTVASQQNASRVKTTRPVYVDQLEEDHQTEFYSSGGPKPDPRFKSSRETDMDVLSGIPSTSSSSSSSSSKDAPTVYVMPPNMGAGWNGMGMGMGAGAYPFWFGFPPYQAPAPNAPMFYSGYFPSTYPGFSSWNNFYRFNQASSTESS
eukprot:CAMPEP_0197519204 /NCGR_PEP_ID=MMETSP1318-20131121/4463_1 /TAXON_ID=552666 /ORGANISM="Partenskyella glossopodia, Strain RCC365" /LENGTH=160 /DNA_ID=CAMNT_0043070047 /DNA_START=75 /DNA_END=557 /DNA_ORIENTATION=-